MDQAYNRNTKLLSNRTVWTIALVAVFILVVAIFGFAIFRGVSNFIAAWNITDLPGLVVNNEATPTLDPSGTQIPAILPPPAGSTGPQPIPWDGASRVNILVMGLDYRDWAAGEGAPRTDTMILISIDPVSKTAGILSIPRDLWVSMPGFPDPNRINVAYRFGETYNLPGGGPELAMNTVEGLLGLPIDYYALIDFRAFERFIDEIGGIEVDIPRNIRVDPIDGDNILLKKGKRWLDGRKALAYARARNSKGGDFDRAIRQQQVIMAIRDRILNSNSLPLLISRAPALFDQLKAGVRTNLTLEQAVQLAWLAQQIPEENIKRGAIGTKQILFGKSPEGDDVLKPIAAEIRKLRDETFTSSGAVSPAAQNSDLKTLVQAENATISVLNGAGTPGLASRTADYLKSQGLNVTSTGDANEQYSSTTIISYKGNPYTLKYLVDLMKINPNYIHNSYDPTSQVDFVIDLGYDWANTNPMP